MILTHTRDRNLWAKETNKRSVQAFFHNRLETWIIHSQSSSLYNNRKMFSVWTLQKTGKFSFLWFFLGKKSDNPVLWLCVCVSFFSDCVCLVSCSTSICVVISSSMMYLQTKLTTEQTPSAAAIKLRKKPSSGPRVGIVQSNDSFRGREWLLNVSAFHYILQCRIVTTHTLFCFFSPRSVQMYGFTDSPWSLYWMYCASETKLDIKINAEHEL